jgi:hypothetical protein
MRKFLSVLVLLALSTACTIWKQQKPAWSNVTGGENLERLLWQEIKAKNMAAVEKHMAPTFVFLSSSGPLDRAATLQRLKDLNLSDYSLGEFNVQPNAADLVVTYTAVLGGQTFHMMTVWQQAPSTKTGWVAIAHADVK